ncbi:hypothetical protein DL764_009498 [Monosporascus ibericus]|uniref:Uncharacterized protein n=1 Tax=Monosporascus ibericus TaxID=155417 RepID=A0A4Q4SUV9_9PEZI|nr:hypothetical protein DL764_009498 [Monosporascus ibericus]
MSNQEFPNSLPRGGMAPLASTREQSIADSVKNSDMFQKAFPDIDWKGAVIEPTVNIAFDLKEKLDPATREKHEYLLGQMLVRLDEPDKAEKSFWEARECLVGHPDVLKQFDAVYIRDDRPVPVMLEQLCEALKLKTAMVEKMGSDSGLKVAAGASVGQSEEMVKSGTGDDTSL